MKFKLNLGCGKDIRKDYINVDYYKHPAIDVVHDLNIFPYPFEENKFDEILLLDILEHLDDSQKCIRELWRISKNNCRIKITVPHYASVNAWGDMTHKRSFSQNSMKHFDINAKDGKSLEFYQKEKFNVDIKLIIPKIYKIFGIGLFIKYLPKIYERFFAYILPIQGLEFYLKVVK